MKSERITLYCKEGSSDKEYQAELVSKNGSGTFLVNYAFGRRGSTLQTGTKTPKPVPYEQAKKIFDGLIKEKTGKGYTQGPDGTPYQHTDKDDTSIRCQLLNPVTDAELPRLIDDPEYWLQEKKDGRRMLVRKTGQSVTGINRKGLAVALPAPVASEAKTLAGEFIMDGECVGDTLFAFDLLTADGTDIRGLCYAERLKRLTSLICGKKCGHIMLVETAMPAASKRILFERLKSAQIEGVVFKQCAAPYTAGRPASGGSQLKYKFYTTASVIVAKVNGDKRSVALELVAGKNKRVSAGNVTIPPNHAIPKPGAIVEIRYLYVIRGSGSLFQPVYLGVRDDIDVRACSVGQLKYRAGDEDDDA